MQGVIRAVGYPIFGLDWTCHQKSGKKIIAIAGGGGSSKSGIKNRVVSEPTLKKIPKLNIKSI